MKAIGTKSLWLKVHHDGHGFSSESGSYTLKDIYPVTPAQLPEMITEAFNMLSPVQQSELLMSLKVNAGKLKLPTMGDAYNEEIRKIGVSTVQSPDLE